MMTLSGDLLGAAAPEHGAEPAGSGHCPPAAPRRVVLPASRERPAVDPYVDTISIGLRKFNIGTVPASVTPPSTWRHAAGCTLAASATALAGLAVLSAAVVGTSESSHGARAVPSPPTDGPAAGTHAGRAAPGRHRIRSHAKDGGRVQNVNAAARSARQRAPARPATVRREADGVSLLAQTRAFYREVATDPDAAYRRTGGALHARGREALRREYDGITSISLETITANPDEGTTTSTMRLHYADGTRRRVTRTCRFTPGERPRIADDGA
jgi:hypothetical protein